MKNLNNILGVLDELRAGRTYHPSPESWEDEVLYFMMLDRFSDGKEANYLDNGGNLVTTPGTPKITSSAKGNADPAIWNNAGGRFCGGTIKGLQSKLGYLKRLGVTAVWVSPIFKQLPYLDTYHGYGIQNFLEVDPRFGTKDELKAMVAEAHSMEIRVILDIIINHTGNVFEYAPDRNVHDPKWDGRTYQVKGFRNADGQPVYETKAVPPEAWPDGAIWPEELQQEKAFERKGRIDNWDYYPEYVEGDFFDLKDVHLGLGEATLEHDSFCPSDALRHIADCYKYWMAYADIDGYRLDTVKHMPVGATRFFASVVHEFGQVLGKERFYVIGEITGGRENAVRTMNLTGLDAALGIDDVQEKLEATVKGSYPAEWYFELFRNSDVVGRGSHTWFRNKVVTMYDDHDQVRRGNNKARFCSWGNGDKLALNALAFNVLSLGIPCIYYGSEQCFDGNGESDRYLRESMFGGAFGAFFSQGHHCFDESNPVYIELGKIIKIREQNLALTRGRQYLREISGDGVNFGYPKKIGEGPIKSVVAWSRIHSAREVLVAINTDVNSPTTAWVTVDNWQGTWKCLYNSSGVVGSDVSSAPKNGQALLIQVPAAGLVIYRKV